jgi:hypothetical protein
MSLDPVALAKARDAYLEALRAGAGPSDVVSQVVQAYQAVRPPEAPSRLCAGVRRLMAMAVGEAQLLDGVSAPTAQRYAYSARRRLDNAQARWAVRTVERGVTVERLPDGPMHDPRRNALAAEIATLKVGDRMKSRVRRAKVSGSVGAAAIAAARRILDNPKADWSFSMRGDGVWITRIAPGEVKRGRRRAAFDALPAKAQWIIEKAARRHGVAPTSVRGKGRRTLVVQARHEAWLQMARLTKANGSPLWPLTTIAGWFSTDHSTVSIALANLGYRRSDAKRALTAAA